MGIDDLTGQLILDLTKEFYDCWGRWPTWAQIQKLLLKPS